MVKPRKKAAREQAQKLLTKLEIATIPVPVEKIARGLGAAIELRPLDEELSGVIFIKDGTPIIGVNSLHHENRRRFTIAHEIGHLILHGDRLQGVVHVDKTFPVLRRDQESASGIDLIEIEANAFAAELLMPTASLELEFATPLDIDDEDRLSRLAKQFKVSTSAMRYRLLGYFND